MDESDLQVREGELGWDVLGWHVEGVFALVDAARSTDLHEVICKDFAHSREIESGLSAPQLLFELPQEREILGVRLSRVVSLYGYAASRAGRPIT
jgi:hypothetical protein